MSRRAQCQLWRLNSWVCFDLVSCGTSGSVSHATLRLSSRKLHRLSISVFFVGYILQSPTVWPYGLSDNDGCLIRLSEKLSDRLSDEVVWKASWQAVCNQIRFVAFNVPQLTQASLLQKKIKFCKMFWYLQCLSSLQNQSFKSWLFWFFM